jgi:hypothetical protein
MTPELETPRQDIVRQRRYLQAASLLKKWLVEDPQYDERVGNALEQLNDDGMQCEAQDDTVA